MRPLDEDDEARSEHGDEPSRRPCWHGIAFGVVVVLWPQLTIACQNNRARFLFSFLVEQNLIFSLSGAGIRWFQSRRLLLLDLAAGRPSTMSDDSVNEPTRVSH